MAQSNRVAIALSSIFAGAAGGGAVATVCVWIANWMNLNGKTTFGDPSNVVFGGVGLGIILAFWRAWTMSGGLGETWRRAAIAVTACFGALAAGMGSYPLSQLSIMLFTPTAQLIVPGYFLLLVIIYVVAWRVGQRQYQIAPAPAHV
jgi:hypothetical protein